MIFSHALLWTLLSSTFANPPCDRTAITGTDDLGFVDGSVVQGMSPAVYGMRFCDNLENTFSVTAVAGQTTVVEFAVVGVATDFELRDSSNQPVNASIVELTGGFRVEFTPSTTGTYYLVSTATSPVPVDGSRYNVAVATEETETMVDYPLLSMSEIVPGEPILFGITNAEPGAQVHIAVSLEEDSWCFPSNPGVCMGIDRPVQLATGVADDDGLLVLEVLVPEQIPAGALLFQAVTIWDTQHAVTPVVVQLND